MIVCIAGSQRIARNLFGFKERRQFFIRMHDVAFAIVAVSITESRLELG